MLPKRIVTVINPTNHVRFDAGNPEHLQAFYMLKFKARQHPTLRFVLEDGFSDVPQMMQSKITDRFISDALKEVDLTKKGQK